MSDWYSITLSQLMSDNDDDNRGGQGPAKRRTTPAMGIAAEVRRLGARMDELREDGLRVEGRVIELEDRVGDLRESTARNAGALEHLAKSYERAASVATEQVLTDLEVKKADALSEIKERDADRELKRNIKKELATKIFAIAMGLWAIIASVLSAKC